MHVFLWNLAPERWSLYPGYMPEIRSAGANVIKRQIPFARDLQFSQGSSGFPLIFLLIFPRLDPNYSIHCVDTVLVYPLTPVTGADFPLASPLLSPTPGQLLSIRVPGACHPHRAYRN